MAVMAAAPWAFGHATAALDSLTPEYTGVPFRLSGWVDRLLPHTAARVTPAIAAETKLTAMAYATAVCIGL
jgi:hypothetical protein